MRLSGLHNILRKGGSLLFGCLTVGMLLLATGQVQAVSPQIMAQHSVDQHTLSLPRSISHIGHTVITQTHLALSGVRKALDTNPLFIELCGDEKSALPVRLVSVLSRGDCLKPNSPVISAEVPPP